TPVFLGDDLTDEAGFAAVNALGGRSIKVGDGPSEARERVASVAAVGSWIEALLNELGVPAEPRIKPD
ncbi:MAG TPA: trehalose-phosphatase, partial [Pseudomonas sp.]|nr:trehalose-phosphatase [Pseudomonas sp.]